MHTHKAQLLFMVCILILPKTMAGAQHITKIKGFLSDPNAPKDSSLGTNEQQGEAVIRFIHDPDPAPEFAVKGIVGSTVNLAGARGKVVLLNFWATWYGPWRSW